MRGAHPTLRIHAGVVLAVSVLLVVRWASSDVPYIWPIAPMFWLVMSLVVHARVRMRSPRGRRPALPT